MSNLKILSTKKYIKLIKKLGSTVQYIQYSCGNSHIEAVYDQKRQEYLIQAPSAVSFIESLTKKLSEIEEILK